MKKVKIVCALLLLLAAVGSATAQYPSFVTVWSSDSSGTLYVTYVWGNQPRGGVGGVRLWDRNNNFYSMASWTPAEVSGRFTLTLSPGSWNFGDTLTCTIVDSIGGGAALDSQTFVITGSGQQ